jgi:2-dehydro-3-deoxyphosphogluconate aldolase/(4S)-4-hydroxy-2-oxoglutarate aldolase
LIAAGLGAVEVSLTTPGALDAIEQLAAEAPPGVVIGAGTVIDAAAAQAAIRCGARLLVSPIVAPDVIAAAGRAGVAAVPGAATPSEMLTALTLGADLVKIFPASLWSPRAVADLLAALPQLPVVPTGGITAERAHEWLTSGAVAVGMGDALARADADALAELRARLTAAR